MQASQITPCQLVHVNGSTESINSNALKMIGHNCHVRDIKRYLSHSVIQVWEPGFEAWHLFNPEDLEELS